MSLLALISSALVLGIVGSLHCLGMCGPLAITLPLAHSTTATKFAHITLYNLGRAFTYALFGIIVGSLGWAISLSKYQSQISIALGLMIFIFLIGKYFFNLQVKTIWVPLSAINKLFTFSKNINTKPLTFFIRGVANGLLPCGLVYTALITASVWADITYSSLFMFVFGMGTWPLMTIYILFGQKILTKLNFNAQRLTNAMIILVGILLIIRGLNLGIPYLSPDLSNGNCHNSCCTKSIKAIQ